MTAKNVTTKKHKKRVLEILEIDEQGQIKIDNDSEILAALKGAAANGGQGLSKHS